MIPIWTVCSEHLRNRTGVRYWIVQPTNTIFVCKFILVSAHCCAGKTHKPPMQTMWHSIWAPIQMIILHCCYGIVYRISYSRTRCTMQYAAFQLIEPFTIPLIHVMVRWYFPYVSAVCLPCAVHLIQNKMWIHSDVAQCFGI